MDTASFELDVDLVPAADSAATSPSAEGQLTPLSPITQGSCLTAC